MMIDLMKARMLTQTSLRQGNSGQEVWARIERVRDTFTQALSGLNVERSKGELVRSLNESARKAPAPLRKPAA